MSLDTPLARRSPLRTWFRLAIVLGLALPAQDATAQSWRDWFSRPAPSTGRPIRLSLTGVRAIDGSNGSSGGGTAGETLRRVAPVTYPGDGTGSTMLGLPDRANPRTISNAVCRHPGEAMPNSRGFTGYVWAWGQLIDHDLDLSETSPSAGTAPIPVEDPADPLGPRPLPFTRSAVAPGTGTAGRPRQHTNVLTACIDASMVYGSDAARAAALRTFSGGLLKTSDHDLLPFNVDGLPNGTLPTGGGSPDELFLAGEVRVNENAVLTAMHTLFVREHNRLAGILAVVDPTADDEKLYQITRKIVCAEIQSITYREFLPALLGPLSPSLELGSGRARGLPTVATEFSTALFRVGHTLLASEIPLVENGQVQNALLLLDVFFRPDVLTSDPANYDRLLEGLVHQRSEEIDLQIIDDVRDFLFGPPGAGGQDLVSLNIQRGRDHGIPDYNKVRAAYGLSRKTSFSQITSNSTTAAALEQVYGSVDNVDLWVGALAEDHVSGAGVGELLAVGIAEQFARALESDRFALGRDRDLRSPGVAAAIKLEDVTLSNIIRWNSTATLLPTNVFQAGTMQGGHVTIQHDPKAGRYHITGNCAANHLMLLDVGMGVLCLGVEGTTIDGQPAVLVDIGSKDKLTIDLGAGDDSLALMMVKASEVLVRLGSGTNSLTTALCSIKTMRVDQP